MGATPTKACDFTSIEAPEFRQFGDDHAQGRLADSGTLAKRSASACQAALFRIAPPIELGKLGLQKIDMPIDGLEHARLTREATAVFLRHDHLDDLSPARHQFAGRLAFAVGDAPGGRADGFGEMGDRRGVEAIGVGELAGRAGEIADLTGIDDRQRQTRGGERACDHRLVSARRLERDQSGMKSAQALDKTLQAFVVARDGEGVAAWADANVQPIFRHIDSHKRIHLPSLHMRARNAAPATVRIR